MNFLNNFPLIASGTIMPSTFVMLDTAADSSVKAAVGAVMPIGISQAGTKAAPGLANAIDSSDTNTQPAANSGDSLGIFGLGDICDIIVGSAAVTAGDLLKPDGNSQAIPASTGDYYGARALTSGAVGELIPALVMYGKK